MFKLDSAMHLLMPGLQKLLSAAADIAEVDGQIAMPGIWKQLWCSWIGKTDISAALEATRNELQVLVVRSKLVAPTSPCTPAQFEMVAATGTLTSPVIPQPTPGVEAFCGYETFLASDLCSYGDLEFGGYRIDTMWLAQVERHLSAFLLQLTRDNEFLALNGLNQDSVKITQSVCDGEIYESVRFFGWPCYDRLKAVMEAFDKHVVRCSLGEIEDEGKQSRWRTFLDSEPSEEGHAEPLLSFFRCQSPCLLFVGMVSTGQPPKGSTYFKIGHIGNMKSSDPIDIFLGPSDVEKHDKPTCRAPVLAWMTLAQQTSKVVKLFAENSPEASRSLNATLDAIPLDLFVDIKTAEIFDQYSYDEYMHVSVIGSCNVESTDAVFEPCDASEEAAPPQPAFEVLQLLDSVKEVANHRKRQNDDDFSSMKETSKKARQEKAARNCRNLGSCFRGCRDYRVL